VNETAAPNAIWQIRGSAVDRGRFGGLDEGKKTKSAGAVKLTPRLLSANTTQGSYPPQDELILPEESAAERLPHSTATEDSNHPRQQRMSH